MQVVAYCFRKRITVLLLVSLIVLYILIGIMDNYIAYFIWTSKVSELRPSELRIILLADSRDLDNHSAARRRNG